MFRERKDGRVPENGFEAIVTYFAEKSTDQSPKGSDPLNTFLSRDCTTVKEISRERREYTYKSG